MDTGIIASRYATALLRLVDETGGGEAVVRQIRTLEKAFTALPEFRRVMDDSVEVAGERKMKLFETALDEPMAPELRKFLLLLMKNGRIGNADFIFHSFDSAYCRSRGIRRGRLVMATASPVLADEVCKRVESETGCRLLLETQVDPALIGGFVFEVDDRMLDASVKHQLETIRHQFVERNRRIV